MWWLQTVNIHLPIHGKSKHLHFPVGGIATFTPVWPSTWAELKQISSSRIDSSSKKALSKQHGLWGTLVYSSYFHDRSKLTNFRVAKISHKNPWKVLGSFLNFSSFLTGYFKNRPKKQPKNHRRKNGFVNSAPYGWCHCHLAVERWKWLEVRGPLFWGGGVGWPSKIGGHQRVPGIYIYTYCISK